MKNEMITNEAIEFFLKYEGNENMFNSDGSINPNYNSFKVTGTLAKIYEDWFPILYEERKLDIDYYRPNAPKEIEKVIDCHNKNLGYSVYICPKCEDAVFVGHTCKSRLCSSCGYKYKNMRVNSIMETAYNCNHRQMVFTIPKEYRKYFFFPFEERINILFQAVNETLKSIANEYYKYNKKTKKMKKYIRKNKLTPGFFAFLHTFGRDLKWNPHIHVLIAEIYLGDDNVAYKNEYFNYAALSKRFQKILLDLLEKSIGNEFTEEKRKSYQNHKNGFYVYAEKKKFKSLKEGVEYVTRYCGRAPISENRIVNYDGTNVTFSYNAHEDDSYHEITVPATEFILMILRHLIPEQFKIIRYYGFYRKKHKMHNKMIMLIDKAKHKIRKELLKYEISIMRTWNRSPYDCPKCGTKLNFAFEVT